MVLLAVTLVGRAQTAPVTLTETATLYTLDNGIVTARVAKASGDLVSLRYKNTEMLATFVTPDGQPDLEKDPPGENLKGLNRGMTDHQYGFWSHDAMVPKNTVPAVARVTLDPASNGGARGEVSVKGISGGRKMGTGPGSNAQGEFIADVEILKRNGDLASLKFRDAEMLTDRSGHAGAYWSHDTTEGTELITRVTIDPQTNGGARGEVLVKGISGGKKMGHGPGVPTLRVAICGTGAREFEVSVNHQSAGKVTLGVGNGAITRHPIQGMWYEREVAFDAALLKAGVNLLTLTIPAGPVNNGLIYDYVRLELEESAEAVTSTSTL